MVEGMATTLAAVAVVAAVDAGLGWTEWTGYAAVALYRCALGEDVKRTSSEG